MSYIRTPCRSNTLSDIAMQCLMVYSTHPFLCFILIPHPIQCLGTFLNNAHTPCLERYIPY